MIAPTICSGLFSSIAVRKRLPGELGEWTLVLGEGLEGLVTFVLFKPGGWKRK